MQEQQWQDDLMALRAASEAGNLRDVAFAMIGELRSEQKALYEGTNNLSAKRKEQVLAEREAPRRFAELKSRENQIRSFLRANGVNVA